MIDELNLMQPVILVEPCSYALSQLEACGSRRGFNPSDIKGRIGRCAWCDKRLKGARRKWCSDQCVQSMAFRCFPQQPDVKMHRLIHKQGFACAGCGESFEQEIRAKILHEFNYWNKHKKPGSKPELVSYFRLGYGTGDRWQTDHIIPIFKGGKGICPTNIQVLCVPCHKSKTIEERR